MGAVFLGIIILAALLAPWMGRHDPFQIELESLNQAPDAVHWLGTDLIGRDVWSRVIHGSRTSLTVGILAVVLSTLIGSLLGALAGYSGGAVDQAVMRATEVMMSIPVLLMVMLFVSLLGPSLTSVTLVIGLLGWSSTCRVVRGEVLVLREKEFIMAARSLGNGHARVILRHILPNTVGPLSVIATFGFANAILLEAALSFLGLGVPPSHAELGRNAQRGPVAHGAGRDALALDGARGRHRRDGAGRQFHRGRPERLGGRPLPLSRGASFRQPQFPARPSSLAFRRMYRIRSCTGTSREPSGVARVK